MQKLLNISGLLLAASCAVNAGTLVNGQWTQTGCEALLPAPAMDDKDVKAFNKSVTAFNEWQAKAQKHFECVVKQAQADNTLIADSVNKAQAVHQAEAGKFTAAADAAEKKLNKK